MTAGIPTDYCARLAFIALDPSQDFWPFRGGDLRILRRRYLCSLACAGFGGLAFALSRNYSHNFVNLHKSKSALLGSRQSRWSS
jgi:hypothetical protein